MPDQDDRTKADEESIPDSSLHAYREGRTEDIKGDGEALTSGDPEKNQPKEIESDDELDLPHEKR